MAEVKMPLSELKAMENKIEKQKEQIEDLKSKQKQVAVNHKYFKARVKGIDRANRAIVDITVRDDNYYNRSYGSPSASAYSTQTLSLSDAYKKGLIDLDFTYQDDEITTNDFINMDEAVEMIRKEEAARVDGRLEEANARASKAEYDLSQADDRYSKKISSLQEQLDNTKADNEKNIRDLRKKHKANLEAKQEVYNTEKQELQDQIDELKGAEKKKTLENQVEELKAEINRLKGRSVWDRIANK